MARHLALLGKDATEEDLRAFFRDVTGREPEARYSPAQPRRPDGKWGSGGIEPSESGGTGGDPTLMENLPPEYQAKIEAQVDKAVPGLTAEQMDANITKQVTEGLADPTNNGKEWYGEANGEANRIKDRDGISEEQAVGTIAAMSPQTQWSDNLAAADYLSRTIKADPVVKLDAAAAAKARTACQKGSGTNHLRATDPTDLSSGTRRLSQYTPLEQAHIIGAMAKGDGVKWGLSSGAEKAVRIQHGESPDSVLGGHKVRSFHDNILNPGGTGCVTIDTHAFSAAAGVKIPSQSEPMKILTGGPSNAKLGTSGTYPAFADAYRRVAAKMNLTPDQAQAIAWVNWRKNNP